MTITYRATFAEPGTEESRKMNLLWSGAWYVAKYITRRESTIAAGPFKTEALASATAHRKNTSLT